MWTGVGEPAIAPVPDGTIAWGNLLAGASRADVKSPVRPRAVLLARRAFVAVIPARLEPGDVTVLFRDEHGAIVPRPLPDDLRARLVSRKRVGDAVTPCPACGRCDWELLTVRAKPHVSTTRGHVTACGICGRIEGGEIGAGRRRHNGLPPGERTDPDGWADTPRREPASVMRAADFTVYGLDPDGVGKTTVGWSRSGDTIMSLSVTHQLARRGEVEITSGKRPADHARPVPDLIRQRLALRLIEAASRSDRAISRRSRAAYRLSAATRNREANARAGTAAMTETTIVVDEEPCPFLAAATNDIWVARSLDAEHTLTITGQGYPIEKIRIVSIAEPDDYLVAAHLEPPHLT
jgi:hypothetical protein